MKKKVYSEIPFIYTHSESCIQCQHSIAVSAITTLKSRKVTCSECGVTFPVNLNRLSDSKKIKSIREIIKQEIKEPVLEENVAKASTQGGNKVEKISLTKYHRYVDTDNFDSFNVDLIDKENMTLTQAVKLSYEQRQKLSDSNFAVVVRVKNKVTGKIEKIRKYPIHDEAHVRNALSRLGQEPSKKGLQKLGVKLDDVLKKVLRKAKQLKMYSLLLRNEDTLKRLGIPIPKVKAIEEAEEEKQKIQKEHLEAIKVVSENLAKVEKELAELKLKTTAEKKTLDKQLEKITAELNEKKQKLLRLHRKEQLGDYAKDLTDEQLDSEKVFNKTLAVKKIEDKAKEDFTAEEGIGKTQASIDNPFSGDWGDQRDAKAFPEKQN